MRIEFDPAIAIIVWALVGAFFYVVSNGYERMSARAFLFIVLASGAIVWACEACEFISKRKKKKQDTEIRFRH